MNRVILLSFLIFAVWLIKKDIAFRKGVSPAVWIPTLWMAALGSRPVSLWLGAGGGDTLEGSPLDRLFFFGLIFAALYTISRRRINWTTLILQNWPVLLFYGYLLLSAVWANSPFASFKRWFKEVGNILMVLVILTEIDPQQAFRAVFVRCAYVLMPLSLIFIRYFPELGRRYNIHSGEIEPVGVTFQKNSLGTMVLVCGVVLLWDWFERTRTDSGHGRRSVLRLPNRQTELPSLERLLPLGVLLIGLYLLYLCDSKTSIVCLLLSGCILAATRLPFLRQRLGLLGVLAGLTVLGFLVLDQLFDIEAVLISSLGRDMTFTGRTDVWRVLLHIGTDPIFGTGFMSFWDDPYFASRLPYWVAFSAHNGYIEVYMAGGIVGVFVLAVMLLGVGLKINYALACGGDYAAVRFAVYLVALISNFFESNFACMTPVGLLFLLAAFGSVDRELSVEGRDDLLTAAHEHHPTRPTVDETVSYSLHSCL